MYFIKTIKMCIRNKIKGMFPVVKSHIEIIAEYIFSEAVEGDYMEFGVFRGDSFIAAYRALENAQREWSSSSRNLSAYSNKDKANNSTVLLKDSIRYFAFDSFSGLPEIIGIDRNHARFSQGRYDCNEKDFLKILAENGLEMNRVVTIPGWFDKTLKAQTKVKYNIKTASVVMIDCDLYESAKYVLDFIIDIITDGTVLIFDDWFNFRGHPEKGERRAVKEWLGKNPNIRLTDYHTYGPTQKSFIVNVINY